jgi:hypothetical protein
MHAKETMVKRQVADFTTLLAVDVLPESRSVRVFPHVDFPAACSPRRSVKNCLCPQHFSPDRRVGCRTLQRFEACPRVPSRGCWTSSDEGGLNGCVRRRSGPAPRRSSPSSRGVTRLGCHWGATGPLRWTGSHPSSMRVRLRRRLLAQPVTLRHSLRHLVPGSRLSWSRLARDAAQ